MDVGKLLSEGPQGKWYGIPNSKARVQIRVPTPAERRKILDRATRKFRRRGQQEEVVNSELVNELLLKISIIDWEGIEQNGEPLPCSDENRVLLDDCWTEFSSLWNDVLGVATEVAQAEEEEETKNSPTGLGST